MQLPPATGTCGAHASVGARGSVGDQLSGSWAAVRWEYTRVDGSGRIDVVADQGGAVTLSISAADYVLSHAPRGTGARGAGGRIRVIGAAWLEFAPRDGETERVEYRRTSGTLVLRSEASSWDFGGRGEERASFTAVLVRI